MTDMDFRRRLPEIRCQSCLLGWAFGPRKLMKNCHGDFIATHERPRGSEPTPRGDYSTLSPSRALAKHDRPRKAMVYPTLCRLGL